MLKKKITAMTAFLLAFCLLFCSGASAGARETARQSTAPNRQSATSSAPPAEAVDPVQAGEVQSAGEARLQDDFYAAANAEWLADARPDADNPSLSVVQDDFATISKDLHNDFLELAENPDKAENKEQQNLALMLDLCMDMESRNKAGIAPLQPYLDKVDAIQGMDDYNELLPDLILENAPLPFDLYVNVSFTDNTENILIGSITPDTYRTEADLYESEDGEALSTARAVIIKTMAQLAGEDEESAEKMAEDAVGFDKMIGQYLLSATDADKAEYETEMTNMETFFGYSKNVDFEKAFEALFFQMPENISIRNEGLYQNLDSIINEENLDMMKNWMKAGYLYDNAMLLSQQFIFAAGVTPDQPFDQSSSDMELSDDQLISFAYDSIGSYLNQEISRYYDSLHMDNEAKQHVAGLCSDVIEAYKKRMQDNNWLQDETKQKALEKLEKIKIYIGDLGFENLHTKGIELAPAEDGGTLFGNVMAMRRNNTENTFAMLLKANEGIEKAGIRDLATAISYAPNASYIPTINSFVVNTAALNPPFYSKDYTESQVYGALGAVIGHEISHAFDQSGSEFDADGNKNNWWADVDADEFQKRTEKMVDFFDGLPYMGGKVNGRQTVTENTADSGGLSVSLELLSTKPDADYDEFFRAWANLYASASTEDQAQQMLLMDIHSPDKYRVNRQFQLIDKFYETYDVGEGDGMYLAPEQRFSIW